MKKSIMLKIILLTISCVLVTSAFASVFADNDVPSLMGNILDGEEEIPDISFPQPEPEPEPKPETPVEPETPTTPEEPSTSGSSSYEESDKPLSQAGLESSVLMVSAFIVFAVIGIYTFMKLSDYSNI